MRQAMVFAMTMLSCAVCAAEVSLPLGEWEALSGDWKTRDGEIIGQAKPGEMAWQTTRRTLDGFHRDFVLSLEFRTPKPANGGVQLRAHWLPKLPVAEGVAPERLPKQMYGYHINIDTSKKDATGAILIAHGEPPLAVPSAEAQAAVKPTDWNKMTIKADGAKLDVSVNGVPAATVEDERFLNGAIALQASAADHAAPSEVEYRNITVTPIEHSGAWRSLFDGTTLTGWKEWGTEKWTIENGVITGGSGPAKSEGYLATEETWKDFDVRGAFKMLGEGNYGLFYHSTIKYDEKQYPVISGLQGEVAPGYPGPTGWVYESYKRGWLVKPDTATMQAFALHPGEWNEIEIRALGNRVTTWVNGIRVLELADEKQQLFEGAFALQLHAGGVEGILWKDLYVRK